MELWSGIKRTLIPSIYVKTSKSHSKLYLNQPISTRVRACDCTPSSVALRFALSLPFFLINRRRFAELIGLEYSLIVNELFRVGPSRSTTLDCETKTANWYRFDTPRQPYIRLTLYTKHHAAGLITRARNFRQVVVNSRGTRLALISLLRLAKNVAKLLVIKKRHWLTLCSRSALPSVSKDYSIETW